MVVRGGMDWFGWRGLGSHGESGSGQDGLIMGGDCKAGLGMAGMVGESGSGQEGRDGAVCRGTAGMAW
jgi:hypothetical protein